MDNPGVTKEKVLKIDTYSTSANGGIYPIDSMQSVFTLTWTTGPIDVKSIVPSEQMINSKNGTYTFTFAPKHAMLSTYVVTIILPLILEV
jgi:hypothetical protein